MPYKCSKCNSDITEEQTAKTVEKFGKALCNKCILDGVDEVVESAPSAPSKEPAQQTYNVGDGGGDDVPVLKHDETKVDGDYEVVPYDPAHDPSPVFKPDKLTTDIIKNYICPLATDKEAYEFLQLCMARGLNPFTKEAYLIKYKTGVAATMVVGKDAFMRRAEEHSQFDGFEAGIIVESENADKDGVVIDEKHGTFIASNEKLVGGWAKVYRKDHKYPVITRVSMKEYDTKKSSWVKIPATMICKVAKVQGLRESFPSDLGGCYDSSEMGAEI